MDDIIYNMMVGECYNDVKVNSGGSKTFILLSKN